MRSVGCQKANGNLDCRPIDLMAYMKAQSGPVLSTFESWKRKAM